MDPAIPLEGAGLGAWTMDKGIRDSYAAQRFNAGLVGAFAVVAVLLAAVGIYGVSCGRVDHGCRCSFSIVTRGSRCSP